MGQKSSIVNWRAHNQPCSFQLPEKYRLLSVLGEGSFGKVLRCQEVDSKRIVAIKIPTSFQDDQEISVLNILMQHNLDQRNIVKFYDSFDSTFGKAMVFEILDMSLLDYIIRFESRPLKLSHIRTIVQQIAIALDALKSVGIIHGDLKLNNIMLVDHARQHLALKVIDFGSAMKASKVKRGKIMQVIPHRAPEVILGLPLSEAIDMWTLGNFMFSMVTGEMLHWATSEYTAMVFITQCFGQPADHLLKNGKYTEKYFNKTGSNSWRIKTPEEYFGPASDEGVWDADIRTLDDWKRMGNQANTVELDQCFELLEAMLKLDPNERITPSEVLKHPFITNSFNSNDASGSAQKKPPVCPPSPRWKKKAKIVFKHPVITNRFDRNSGSAQKKPPVRCLPPQWSTSSDTDSCMIFNFGNNSSRSQLSTSIHESLKCEPPATDMTDDANDNIQPDHHSPSPTVQPSGVLMVHPATDLGSQDCHRSLCKIKVGPASPENTTELEDEESSVSLEIHEDKTSRTRPSTSTEEFFSSGLPATALNTANIQPDCQRSLCKIKVEPAAPENTTELEDEEGSVSLEIHEDKTSRTQPSTSTEEFFSSGLPATNLNTANIQPDCQRSLCKIKVGPASPENTTELEDEESSVSLEIHKDETSRTQPSTSTEEFFSSGPPATALNTTKIKVGPAAPDNTSELEDEESSVSLEIHKDETSRTQPSTSTEEFFNSGPPATALNTTKIKVGPAAPDNTSELEDEESSVSLGIHKDETSRTQPSTSTEEFFNFGPPATALNTVKIKVGPAAPENTSELEDEESSVSLQAGQDTTSESIVEVKESDKMVCVSQHSNTCDEIRTKEKKRKKSRIQRVFSWIRKTFSRLSSNKDVMDKG